MNQASHQSQSQIELRSRDPHHIQHHHPTLYSIESIERISRSTSEMLQLDKRETDTRMKTHNVKVNINKAKSMHNRRILSPALISLILVIHLISNQSFLSSLLEAGKGFTFVSSNDNSQTSSRRTPAPGLINFVSADPEPLPAKSSNARASTARTNRGPPINGSMFGKRSVNNLSSSTKSSATDSAAEAIIRKQTALDYVKAKNKQNKLNSHQSSQAIRLHSVESYHDVVTEIIENFLASNNENDPEEASLGFCRMIVYECTKMLSSRDKALAKRRKRLPVNLAAKSV